jgi:hypothetical protein
VAVAVRSGHDLTGFAPVDRAAIAWLLDSDEPAIRAQTLAGVVGLDDDDAAVRAARRAIHDGPIVRTLLAGQGPDGDVGVPAYAKWAGTHWRLLSLAELDAPPDARMRAAAEHELAWIRAPSRVARARRAGIDGRVRWCGSQDGAALLVCVRLGMADDERVGATARSLVEWQWPDGGWNCDVRPAASRSSFNETLKALWGLAEFATVTGDQSAREAADRAAEFLLRHRLYRSERTGQPHEKLLRFRVPAYWHYDALDGLLVLARIGRLDDERTGDALDEVERQRRPDGRWAARGRHWRPPGSRGSNVEVVDWGPNVPNERVTLHALTVLRAAGRIGPGRATA